MKTIQFNENARDVWHDAKEELPDSNRGILIGSPDGAVGSSFVHRHWPFVAFTHWRELPAPPKPTPKIVPHSLEHWHDPRVERPEPGHTVVAVDVYAQRKWTHDSKSIDWDVIYRWCYSIEPEDIP